MDAGTIVLIVLPLVVGGGLFATLLLLTRIMPGEPVTGKKAVQPKTAPVPARGPEYIALSGRRKAAYRVGLMVLFALAALTILEFFAAALGSTALMFMFMVLKGAAILYFFMHLTTVWKSEEAH